MRRKRPRPLMSKNAIRMGGSSKVNQMRAIDLVLRCYAEHKDGYWQAFCLDLCLAAQGDSFDEVKQKLETMINEYVHDAVAGPDKDYVNQLLRRRAPLRYWLEYYLLRLFPQVGPFRGRKRLFSEALPLVLAH